MVSSCQIDLAGVRRDSSAQRRGLAARPGAVTRGWNRGRRAYWASPRGEQVIPAE